MKKVIIAGNNIAFASKDDLLTGNLTSDFVETFRIADHISQRLNIPCPDIAIRDKIIRPDPSTGCIAVLDGMHYSPTQIPELNNSLIILSTDCHSGLQYTGTVAHEIRHVWQDIHAPEINKKPAVTYGESLLHPAEIDADGYAIWYISSSKLSIEDAAALLCPDEKAHHPDAYLLRIKKAHEMKALTDTERANMYTPKEHPYASVFGIIRNLFR